MAFDGQLIWIANHGTGPGTGSVSNVNVPLNTVTTVSTGFSQPFGIVYDGTTCWVTDSGDNQLKRLDSSGSIVSSVSVDAGPAYPTFDGTNIWIPNNSANTVSVVRATGGLAGTVLATLSGNGLNAPLQAAFDGERILVTNFTGASVSLWKASDMTPIGTISIGTPTLGACSDGLNFWVTLYKTVVAGSVARF